jgi:hypothetical protein
MCVCVCVCVLGWLGFGLVSVFVSGYVCLCVNMYVSECAYVSMLSFVYPYERSTERSASSTRLTQCPTYLAVQETTGSSQQPPEADREVVGS